jgi:hypothetical protein
MDAPIYQISYKRTHLQSGSVQTFDFKGSHSVVFGELSDAFGFSKKVVAAKSLIDGWNRMHRDTWQYELVIFGDRERLERLEQLHCAMAEEETKLREVRNKVMSLHAEIGALA